MIGVEIFFLIANPWWFFFMWRNFCNRPRENSCYERYYWGEKNYYNIILMEILLIIIPIFHIKLCESFFFLFYLWNCLELTVVGKRRKNFHNYVEIFPFACHFYGFSAQHKRTFLELFFRHMPEGFPTNPPYLRQTHKIFGKFFEGFQSFFWDLLMTFLIYHKKIL